MGRIYRTQKQYGYAEKIYHEALDLASKNNVEYEHAVCNVFLGHIYRDTEQYEKAIKYFEQAIIVFGNKIRPSTKADLSKHLHSVYYKANELDKAYLTLLDYVDIRLKLQDENRIKETTKLQAEFETKEKEAQLKQLQIDNLNSELRLLKSQMNPHFMFNAIGSVSTLMQSGRVDEAQDSLHKFSRLMRSTLEQSQGDDIILEDEIDFLNNYLHLEKLILGDDFSFEIQVDENIDIAYERIPALILQPIVENALKHGLRTKFGQKILYVSFAINDIEEQTQLLIRIDDNGIGRKAADELNKNRKNHQSFATKSIDDRIKLLNEQHQSNISIETIDKYDDQNYATGTLVLIKIIK